MTVFVETARSYRQGASTLPGRYYTSPASQQGISSRAYAPGPYSPRESLPAAWDRQYLRQFGDLPEPSSARA